MKRLLTHIIVVVASWFGASALPAQVTVYDTVTTSPIAGFGDANANNPIFGDSLNLAQGGPLQQVGFDVFNPGTSGGPILTGTVFLSIYDNTVAYSSGSLAATNPLLGSFSMGVDFGTGLNPGFFTRVTTGNLSTLNIVLPPNILITQQFTQTTGTATRNGTLVGQNSATGSSPNTVYINSSGTAEGLYSFTGAAANSQFAFAVVVPEPGSLALAGLGLAGAAAVAARRRRRAAPIPAVRA